MLLSYFLVSCNIVKFQTCSSLVSNGYFEYFIEICLSPTEYHLQGIIFVTSTLKLKRHSWLTQALLVTSLIISCRGGLRIYIGNYRVNKSVFGFIDFFYF